MHDAESIYNIRNTVNKHLADTTKLGRHTARLCHKHASRFLLTRHRAWKGSRDSQTLRKENKWRGHSDSRQPGNERSSLRPRRYLGLRFRDVPEAKKTKKEWVRDIDVENNKQTANNHTKNTKHQQTATEFDGLRCDWFNQGVLLLSPKSK